jgi:hypothetical protein
MSASPDPDPRTGRGREVIKAALITLSALVVFNQGAFEWAMQYLAEESLEARSGRFSTRDETLRLLFVGDSYTAGELSESGRGYWAYVPDELAALGYPRPVETVSIALAGSTSWFHTHQVAGWLEESGQRTDYVMTMGNANDRRGYDFQRRFCASEGGQRDVPLIVRALYAGPPALLFPFNYLGMRLSPRLYMDEVHDSFGPLRRWWEANEPYGKWLPGESGAAVEALVELTRAEGATPLAGAPPYQNAPWSAGIPEAAQRLAVPFFNLAVPEVQAALASKDLLTGDGWHPNDAGHRYIAKRWARWFMDSVEPTAQP